MNSTIFFDLDGTIIDSKLDIANSINASFKHFSLSPLPNKEIYKFVGNGVRDLIEDCLLKQNKLQIFYEFLEYFLAYYYNHIVDNTYVYEGTIPVLEKLSKKHELFIVTNKSTNFSLKVVKEFNLEKYFTDIVCGDTFEFKKPHPQPILELIKKYGIKDKAEKLFIGDSENDILSAKAANIKIAWISYGFRDKTILKNNPVDYIINRPADILSVLS